MPDDTDAIAQLQASCPELFSQNVEDFDDESRPVKRLRTERDRAPRAPRPRPAKPAEPKAKPKAAAEAKSVAGFYSKAAVVEAPEPAELVLPELEASDDEVVCHLPLITHHASRITHHPSPITDWAPMQSPGARP